jgi:hypothetical protein
VANQPIFYVVTALTNPSSGQQIQLSLVACPTCYAMLSPDYQQQHYDWHAKLNANMATIQSRISLSLLGGAVTLNLV